MRASGNWAWVRTAHKGASGLLDTVTALRGIATAPHHLAAQAGRDVLRDGGNAVEAAVAMAACLAVVYPHMNSIGGDGFWLVARPDGSVTQIDAGGRAAARANVALYGGQQQVPWRGPLAAITVAGAVSGWDAALQLVPGRLPAARLLAPAIEHAAQGVAVTANGARIAAGLRADLRLQPGDWAAIFEPAGRPMAAGEPLRQPALADALGLLARDGLDSFYRGALAARMAQDLNRLGSPVTREDLAAQRATPGSPLTVRIRGAALFNTAPPTQGAAALLTLALFDRLEADEAEGYAHIHGLVEATKLALLYRNRFIDDPAYMTVDPRTLFGSDAALDAIAAQIRPARARPWPEPPRPGDTCWFGAADAEGNVVSCIQSAFFEFGSGVVLPQTGIIWQNRGSSFSLHPGARNALMPGRRPFSTLSPALARFDDGRVMAYGTMGGEGQAQTQAMLFSRYARFGCGLQDAISRPRWLLGKSWGVGEASLKMEDRFAPDLYRALEAAGHRIERVESFTDVMGHAGAVVRHAGGLIEGAWDPRGDGGVAAW